MQYTTELKNNVFKNFKDVTNINNGDRIIMYNFIKAFYHEGCVCYTKTIFRKAITTYIAGWWY